MVQQEAKNLDFFSTAHREAIGRLDARQLAEMDDSEVSVFRLGTSERVRGLLSAVPTIPRLSSKSLYRILRLDPDKLEILMPYLTSVDHVSDEHTLYYARLPLEAIRAVTVERLMRDDHEHLGAFFMVLDDDEDAELAINPGYAALFEVPIDALEDFDKDIFQNPALRKALRGYIKSPESQRSIQSQHLGVPDEDLEFALLIGHRSKEVQDFYANEVNRTLVRSLVPGRKEELSFILNIPLVQVEALGLADLVTLSKDELRALESFPFDTLQHIGLDRYRSLNAKVRIAVGQLDLEVFRIFGIDILVELFSRTPDRSEVLKGKCTKIGSTASVYNKGTGRFSHFTRDDNTIDASRIIPENCAKFLNLLSVKKLNTLAGEERELLLDSTVSDFAAMLKEELMSQYGHDEARAQDICHEVHRSRKNDRAFTLSVLSRGFDEIKANYFLRRLPRSDWFFLDRVLDLKAMETELIIQAVRAIQNSNSGREALEALFTKKSFALNKKELLGFLEERRRALIDELGPWKDNSDDPTATLTADQIRSWGSSRMEYPKQTAEWRRAVGGLEAGSDFLDFLFNVEPAVIRALPDDSSLRDLILQIGIPNLREMTHADIMRVLAQKEALLKAKYFRPDKKG